MANARLFEHIVSELDGPSVTPTDSIHEHNSVYSIL